MISIAIDGPAGAGKSTIARMLAKELGYIYVDTGALYRAVGLHASREWVEPGDRAGMKALLPSIHISLRFVDGVQRVFLNGEDVSEEIRRPEMSMAASTVSALPEVRAFLLDLQKNLARENDVVMDGRDIGTVVLPDAQVKIFLTAALEERARRRYEELIEKGHPISYDRLLIEMRQRDQNDSARKIAPLQQAPDAELMDTTGNTLEQTVERITTYVKGKLADAV